jgi:tetratricopeptide (TPR) repeat protein
MVNDYRCRIVALYGKRAIGKTALVTIGVSQVLPPQWVRVAVRLTEGVGYQRFVLELAEKLGVSAPDSLKPLTNRESHNLTRELLRSFDRLEAAYMVIDDWHYAMDYDGYRDVRFKSFLYQVARRQSYRGNKVIVASRLHLIPPVPSMAQLTLGPLPSDSMRTIVDWAVLASGSVPAKRSIVTAFIARLKGNPLAATLGAHLLGAIPTERLLANINAQKTYQARLPALVLDKIRLNRDEQVLLGYLSVFATPAELEELEAFLGPHVSGLLEYYLDRFVISYDSDCGGYYLSPLVRDYIQAQTSDDVLVSYHRLAADNYRRRLKARGSSVRDQSELVAHLAGCHSLDELQELGGAFVESVTPAVKKLVKSGRYTEALAFFALVERHRPLDYDVKLQIALCRAALHDWEGAEAYRREALRLNPKAWWVHAEYGRALEEHSRSEEAGYHLSRAREMCNALAYSSRQWSLSWVDRLLGSFSERQKQWEQALRYYSRSVEEYPNSTAGKVALARTLWSRSANAGAALDLLNDAAMGDPLDRSVFLLRREILEATNPEHEDPPSNPSRVGER